MPYGLSWKMEDIEERRKQRLMERNTRMEEIQQIMNDADTQLRRYARNVTYLGFAIALILYWLVGPFAGIFAMVLTVGFHLHWLIRWHHLYQLVTQKNQQQNILMAMEVCDDILEAIAKQNRGAKCKRA